jgi:hypothetical protein
MKRNFLFRSLPDPVILLLALVTVAAHLLVACNLGYNRDEMLYFTLGQHPAFGYNSVPPLIGWIAGLMQTVFGNSVFAVRLFPALLGGALIVLTSSIATEFGGSKYASFLSAIGLMISIFFMRSYMLYMPVHLEIFLWTLCIYLIIRYINTSNDKFLLMFGIAAGITLLNKYLAGIFFIGLIAIIPFTTYRKVFASKMFYYGIAAGFFIFLPNILWQISKGFPATSHINELYSTQLVHMNIPLFLTEQITTASMGSFFTIGGLIWLLSKKENPYRFLGVLVVFVIIALMLLKGKSYYTLGVFPFLIAAGAVSYDKWISQRWIRIVFPIVLIIFTIPIIPFGLPVFKLEGMKKYFSVLHEKYKIDIGTRFEDGSIHSLPQDYADMLGWDELTQIADKAYRMIDNKKAAFIYGDNYGQASAISVIGQKYGLPEALCFSESYQYWLPKHFDPDITSIVYINNNPPGEDVKSLFRKIYIVGSITNPDSREYGTTVYLCQEPLMSFNKFWAERLKRKDS